LNSAAAHIPWSISNDSSESYKGSYVVTCTFIIYSAGWNKKNNKGSSRLGWMSPSPPPWFVMDKHKSSATTIIIILYESRASRVGTRCIIKYYNIMFMPVASSTATSRGGTDDRRPPHVLPDGSSFDGWWLFGWTGWDVCRRRRIGGGAMLSHSPVATTRRQPSTYRTGTAAVWKSPCTLLRRWRQCSHFPTPPPWHPRSRLPTPIARGQAASRFSLLLRSVAFRRACASVIWLVLSP